MKEKFEIVSKKRLNATVTKMEIYAPLIAKKAQAGQFVILRAEEDGERIPLTVAGYDRERGTVDIIFQIVGAATMKLDRLEEGDRLPDFAGPLGNATKSTRKRKWALSAAAWGAPSRCLWQRRFAKRARRWFPSSVSAIKSW